MIRPSIPRLLAAALALMLACPVPSFALRTQAGLESPETEHALTTTLTGLEESHRAYDEGTPIRDESEFLRLHQHQTMGLQVRDGTAVEYYEVVRHEPTKRAVVFVRVTTAGRWIEPAVARIWPFNAVSSHFSRLVALRTGLEEGARSSDSTDSSTAILEAFGEAVVPDDQSPLRPSLKLERDAGGQVTAVYAYDDGDDQLARAWRVPLNRNQAQAYLEAAMALAAMRHDVLVGRLPPIPAPAASSGPTVRYVLQGEGLAVAPAFAAAGIRDFVAVVKTLEDRPALQALGVNVRNILVMETFDAARIPHLAEDHWVIDTAQGVDWLPASLKEAHRIPPVLMDPLTDTIRASRKFLAAIGV